MDDGVGAADDAWADYYHRLHSECGEVLVKSIAADRHGLQASSHALIMELESWVRTILARPESSVLAAATREYQFALLAVIQGQYRHAFAGLRSVLELALGTVYFSAQQLELREWQAGARDLNWNTLLGEEDGVLSARYAQAFFPALAHDIGPYRQKALNVYRMCSEFVHANVQTQELLPWHLAFKNAVYDRWHAEAAEAACIIVFTLCLRYLPELNQQIETGLENSVLDRVGHVAAIRSMLGGTVEP